MIEGDAGLRCGISMKGIDIVVKALHFNSRFLGDLLERIEQGIKPEEVGYINAHGTSTPYNDKFETLAIRKTFGEHAYELAVSSTKSMTGHLLGAAGGIEGVFSVLSLHRKVLPPTINYVNPDPDCDLDYVPNVPREAEVEYALSNSFGFGGTNAALLFKRYDE